MAEVIEIDSDDNEPKIPPVERPRVAKKSTTTISRPEVKTVAAPRRPTTTLNYSNKKDPVLNSKDRFMENFNPETSVREKRKLRNKINNSHALPRKPTSGLYDEMGIHYATGVDLCDCLVEKCPGCHFPCPKCSSEKCGHECRVNRKYMYEELDYEKMDYVVKNPLL